MRQNETSELAAAISAGPLMASRYQKVHAVYEKSMLGAQRQEVELHTVIPRARSVNLGMKRMKPPLTGRNPMVSALMYAISA